MKKMLALCVLVVLFGCAPQAVVKEISLSELIGEIDALNVVIEAGPASLDQTKEFLEAIKKELQNNGFKLLSDEDEKNGNRLIIVIKKIRAVPMILKPFLGDFTGRSKVEAEIDFQQRGNSVFKFLIEGSSAGLGTNSIFTMHNAMIGAAFKAAAKEIASELHKRLRK